MTQCNFTGGQIRVLRMMVEDHRNASRNDSSRQMYERLLLQLDACQRANKNLDW
jgi:hypothetical protein